MKDLKKLISEMTLEEKAGICSGADFWHTKAVERLQIPDMMMSDGPHGLRKQDVYKRQVLLLAAWTARTSSSAFSCR